MEGRSSKAYRSLFHHLVYHCICKQTDYEAAGFISSHSKHWRVDSYIHLGFFFLWLRVSLSDVLLKSRDANLGWSCMSWAYQQQEAAFKEASWFLCQGNTKWKQREGAEGGEWEVRSFRAGVTESHFTHFPVFVCLNEIFLEVI